MNRTKRDKGGDVGFPLEPEGQTATTHADDALLPSTVSPLQKELDLAEKVQKLLFPKASPVCTWCCTSVYNIMAEKVGGDFFDFITMPDGCQAIFIGDVTGRGIHASIVMSLIYGFIHRASHGLCAPVTLVHDVNRFLISFGSRSKELDYLFSATLFCGIVNPLSRTIQYVNAGHVPPLVKRGNRVHELRTNAQPVGFFENQELSLSTFHFEKNDRFLLYTDGIPETAAPEGELFGMERLRALLRKSAEDQEEFLRQLFAEMDSFRASPHDDDCTAIVIDLHGIGD